jgi:GxxExxY protein
MTRGIDNRFEHSELTHQIIGLCFEVFNQIGSRKREKLYQKALAIEFDNNKLKYKIEVPWKIAYKGKLIGRRRFDFVVEDKVLVELKAGSPPQRSEYEQVHEYLKLSGLKIGLLVNFTTQDVKIKRIANVY